MNFQEDELKGVRKDRMKIGKSLADVDPMQIDSSVSAFNSLRQHLWRLSVMGHLQLQLMFFCQATSEIAQNVSFLLMYNFW